MRSFFEWNECVYVKMEFTLKLMYRQNPVAHVGSLLTYYNINLISSSVKIYDWSFFYIQSLSPICGDNISLPGKQTP
jgi:hypothetical protein